jgi:hypothetical protein
VSIAQKEASKALGYRWPKGFQLPDAATPAIAGSKATMLILRGIAGRYAGRDWPRGALDEPSALEYARRRGYDGRVLDVAGATGAHSPQTQMALTEFRRDPKAAAIYGFSGGGYNGRPAPSDINVLRAALGGDPRIGAHSGPAHSPRDWVHEKPRLRGRGSFDEGIKGLIVLISCFSR